MGHFFAQAAEFIQVGCPGFMQDCTSCKEQQALEQCMVQRMVNPG